MPVSFDFNNESSAPVSGSTMLPTFTTGSFTISNTADGVKFTLSYSGNFAAFAIFGNSAGSPGLSFLTSTLGTGPSTSGSFTLSFFKQTNPSDKILSGTAANPIQLSLAASSGFWQVRFINTVSATATTKTLTTSVFALSGTHKVTHVQFSTTTGGALSLQSLSGNALNCFCAGTLIDTPAGKRPVEELMAGDKVLTADGKETTVHWLGQQFVDTTLRHPRMVNPICITTGALGGGLPERDLFLSQDHAVAIDGTLYNAGALLNGETIYQVVEMPLDGFTYYHVETDAHELLVAEGVAAESYINYAGREGFDNAKAGTGREIAEMDLPRVSTSRMVPEYLKPRKIA